jgi:hypothetical protein
MKCFGEICSVKHFNTIFMKKNLQKYSLLYSIIWLSTGFVLSYFQSENILTQLYLGAGVLFTLFALKKLNYKIN